MRSGGRTGRTIGLRCAVSFNEFGVHRFRIPALLALAVAGLGACETPVEPGPAFAIRTEPAEDTAVYVGASFTLDAYVIDSYSKRRGDAVALRAMTDHIVINGRTIVGQRVGFTGVVLTAGVLADTIRVSVVPRGTLAVFAQRRQLSDTLAVRLLNLDGSGQQRIAFETPPGNYGTVEPVGSDMPPSWHPTGGRVVYHQGQEKRLFAVDVPGTSRPLSPGAVSEVCRYPVFSPTGDWIYCDRADDSGSGELWRVRPDGTGLEKLPAATQPTVDSRPDLSPDGAFVAYTASRPMTEGNPRVHVRSVATGARTLVDVHGTNPRWSPDGTMIAFVSTFEFCCYTGELRVVNADGTGERVVASGAYEPGVAWSPDGMYIVAVSHTHELNLINVATGERMPIPTDRWLRFPAWRPGSSVP